MDTKPYAKRLTAGAILLALIALIALFWPTEAPPEAAASHPTKVSPARTASSPELPRGEPQEVTAGDEAPAEPALLEEIDLEGLPPGIPRGVARCNLSPALPLGSGHLVIGDPGRVPYDGRRVSVSAGTATLPLVEDAGAGVLAIDGYAPVEVTWTEQGCSPDPVVLAAGETWLSGHVRNAEGEPEGRVFVEGCGNQALTDAEGSYAMAVAPGPCTVNAFRRDGLLVGKADAAALVIEAGKEHVMNFTLPELPTAGLGIQIASSEEGFAIQGVVPGTAAEEFGLESGDVVIEVDGTPTKGLSIEEFVDLAVGPVGTDVDIVVMRDGQP